MDKKRRFPYLCPYRQLLRNLCSGNVHEGKREPR